MRVVDVHEVDQEGKRLGSNECLSADFVFQSEGLEKTHLARDRLLEGAGDYFLDRVVGDADGHEGGEDDPVQLL